MSSFMVYNYDKFDYKQTNKQQKNKFSYFLNIYILLNI